MLDNVEFRWYQRRPIVWKAGPPAPVLQYRVAKIVPAVFSTVMDKETLEHVEWSEWKNIPTVRESNQRR